MTTLVSLLLSSVFMNAYKSSANLQDQMFTGGLLNVTRVTPFEPLLILIVP